MNINIINKGCDAEATCGECGRSVIVREIELDDEAYVAELLECEWEWAVVGDICFCETCKEKPEVQHWMESWSPKDRRLFDVISEGRMITENQFNLLSDVGRVLAAHHIMWEVEKKLAAHDFGEGRELVMDLPGKFPHEKGLLLCNPTLRADEIGDRSDYLVERFISRAAEALSRKIGCNFSEGVLHTSGVSAVPCAEDNRFGYLIYVATGDETS